MAISSGGKHRRSYVHSERGWSTAELLIRAAVFSVISFLFFIVWDWVDATVDGKVDRAKERNVGRTVQALEYVVERDKEGTYVITFRTG